MDTLPGAGDLPAHPRFWQAVSSFRLPILLFAGFAVVIACMGWTVFRQESRSIEAAAKEDLQIIGRLRAKAVGDWIAERESDAKVLADILAASESFDSWVGNPDPARTLRNQRRLQSYDAYGTYSNVVVVDLAGRVLAGTKSVPPSRDEIVRTLGSLDPEHVVERTDVHRVGAGKDKAEIHVTSPVISIEHPGVVLALVILTIDPELALVPMIGNWPGTSPSAEIYVVQHVADSPWLVSRPRHAPLDEQFSVRLAAAGTLVGLDARNAEVLATAAAVPGTDWLVIAKIDTDEVYAPVRGLAVNVTAITGLLILALALAMIVAWGRQEAALVLGRYRDRIRHQEMAQRFEYLSKFANDIILLLDPAGRILEANDRAASVYGVSRDELVGAPFLDFVTPGEKAAVEQRLRALDQSREGAIFETMQRRMNHPPIPVEISARRINHGSGVSAQLIIRDISERHHAAESASHLASIVESSADAVFSLDRSGRVLTWNKAAERLYGYSAAEIVGQSLSLTLPADRQDELDQLLNNVLAGAAVAGYETVRRRKDGSRFDASIVAAPITDRTGAVIAASSVVRDITERKSAERQLRRTAHALATLSESNAAVIRATDVDALLQEMCDIIVHVGGYRMAWIGAAENDAEKSVRPLVRAGTNADYLDHADVSWGDNERGRGPTGRAIRERRIFVNSASLTNPDMLPWREQLLARGHASSVALPFDDGVHPGCALNIYSQDANAFGPEEVKLLSDLTGNLAFGLAAMREQTARAAVTERLAKAMIATVQAIAGTLEMRDPYTAGHQRRVTDIAGAIAVEMGLPADRIEGLRMAGIVHDLGKINIPSEILSKPSRLSRLEFELIKTHPQIGYDILKNVEFPWPIADIVVQHHERLDGSGYPNGLKGDGILLEARILAIADVVEAMVSHRPYRPGLGIEAALAEIREGRGRLYDPAGVDACLRAIEKGTIKLSQSTGNAA